MQRVVRKSRWSTLGLVAVGSALALATSACGSAGSSTQATSQPAAACPTAPADVAVTTNVWGSIVDQLAGSCANVTTVVTNSAADPHDFEPTAATSSAYASAGLVVMNGLGYDSWSDRILKSLGAGAAPVLNLGTVVGLKPGANPHIWYSPTYVTESATAITAQLKKLVPAASGYFDTQAAQFAESMKPYFEQIAAIKAAHSGTKIGVTESVFDYLAQATGLVVATPPGFLTAVSNDSEPSAVDVAAFRAQLADGTDKVLVNNTASSSPVADQLLAAARRSAVPVVDVTETLSPPGETFQAWQIAQLKNLAQALG